MNRLWIVCLILIFACSSTPERIAPAWTQEPTRTMDNGYIVYVGQGEDASPERANFKAEATAIGDVSNECSFVPKGARIEDKYDDFVEGIHHVYAKIGLTFEECEGAKKAVQPEAIKNLANVAMTDQWKRYQDLYYTADNGNPPPTDTPINDESDYYVQRQQVAWAKQTVILSPGPWPPAQTQVFITQVQPASNRIVMYERTNPAIINTRTAWSGVVRNPGTRFPSGFPHSSAPAFHSPAGFRGGPMNSGSGGGGYRRGGGGGYRGGGGGGHWGHRR